MAKILIKNGRFCPVCIFEKTVIVTTKSKHSKVKPIPMTAN